MNNKTIQLAISLGIGLVIWLLLMFLSNVVADGSGIQRVIQLFGGTATGIIHALMYATFIYSFLELRQNQQFINEQHEGFDLKILPEKDQLVLNAEQVAQIKLDTLAIEKQGNMSLVTEFIKKACTQYRNDNSVSDTLSVFDKQVNNTKEEIESSLEIVQYLIGAIISLGFIGTLLGLSKAIGMSHLAKTDEGMPMITEQLNVAFDTTLIALFLGLMMNFFFHNYLKDLDLFFSQAKSYVIDNLISRIYGK